MAENNFLMQRSSPISPAPASAGSARRHPLGAAYPQARGWLLAELDELQEKAVIEREFRPHRNHWERNLPLRRLKKRVKRAYGEEHRRIMQAEQRLCRIQKS